MKLIMYMPLLPLDVSASDRKRPLHRQLQVFFFCVGIYVACYLFFANPCLPYSSTSFCRFGTRKSTNGHVFSPSSRIHFLICFLVISISDVVGLETILQEVTSLMEQTQGNDGLDNTNTLSSEDTTHTKLC